MVDSLRLVRCLIANTWNALLTVQVPGLGISFAALFVGIFLFAVGITIIKIVLGSPTQEISGNLFTISKHRKGE